jgi:hypothetical protein
MKMKGVGAGWSERSEAKSVSSDVSRAHDTEEESDSR